MCGALGKSSTVSHYPKEEQRDEKDASTSDVALNPPVRRRRAVMVGVARSVLFGAAACVLAESFVREDVQASEDVEDETAPPLNEFTFKTFTLRAPGFYKEVDVDYDKGRLSGANGLELLIRDSRFGLAGNTITLSKQGSPIDPNTKQPLFSKTEDLGDVDAVAEKLVAGENQRNKGANAILKESKKGTVDGTTCKDRSLCARVSLSRAKIYVRVSLFLSFFPFFFFLGALLEVSLAQIRRARNRSGESFEFQVLVRALVLLILFLIGTRASNLAFLSGGRRGRRRRLAFR